MEEQNQTVLSAEHEIHHENRRRRKKKFLVVGVLLLLVVSFMAGAKSAGQGGLGIINKEGPVGTVDYSYLWKALDVVNKNYVDKPIDQQQLMYGAVDGLLRALGDPHSTFLDPEENEKFMADLEGNFEGIGAEINIKDDVLTVVAPLPDTPAERAGLRAQDIILKIDGQDTFNMGVEDAVSKIRGEKGSTVVLTIVRDDSEGTQDISIVRDEIHVKSVTTEVKNANGKKIGVIKLSRFGPDSTAAFKAAVDDMTRQSVNALIVDMRNNPGGLLDSAIDISSLWVSRDEVVLKEVNAQKKEYLFYSKGPATLAKMKTIVLINQGSASASEIVTGALQDHKLATVVGQKSYGKGSVQDLIEIGKGAAVKITIAKWLTPDGRSIDKQGLEPDVEVKMTSEDYDNDRDPQMDKAVELAAN